MNIQPIIRSPKTGAKMYLVELSYDEKSAFFNSRGECKLNGKYMHGAEWVQNEGNIANLIYVCGYDFKKYFGGEI